jgi:DNA polymerase III delta prime subunit
MNINDLMIPNKEYFEDFYAKRLNENNLNILLYGPRESCKTTIIETIIHDFLQRYKDRCQEKQLIFRLNAFDEINLQAQNNEMNIFCQNNTNTHKIVYIDKFEFFGDYNQQLLKMYIDKYNGAKKTNKVFFIVETIQIEKVRDIIKSRLNIFKTEPLTNTQYKNILLHSLQSENIYIEKKTMDYIVNIPNMYVSSLKNIVNKCKLLDYKHITSNELSSLCNFIDFSLFDNYFKVIHENIKQSCDILISLHDDGYDISDIYFFLYDYIKTQKRTELYCVVELICFYINEIYNGNYNKIMLIIMTYEIQQKLVLENKALL